jgi:type I restriction enzyme S subunit
MASAEPTAKAGWEKTTLGEVALVQSGAGFPKKYQGKHDLEFPFYKVSDMNLQGNEQFMQNENNSIDESVRNELRAQVFTPGSIIFPKIGAAIATNKKRIVTKACCVDNNVMGLLPNEDKISTQFLFHFLLQFNLSDFANQSELPSIRKLVVQETELLIPPLPEQERIVGILDEAFEGIAEATAQAEKNLHNARELFQSVLQSTFSQKGDDWVEQPIEELCRVVNGFAFKSTDFSSSKGVRSIKITNVGVDEFVCEDGNRLPVNFASSRKEVQVTEGNIVIALTRSIISTGFKVALVPSEYDGALVNQRVAALEAKSEKTSESYLYAYLRTQLVIDYVKERVNTLMQPNLSIKDLRAMPVPTPPLPTQQAIVEKLDALSEETKRLEAIYERKQAALSELKQSLLQKAFAGEL